MGIVLEGRKQRWYDSNGENYDQDQVLRVVNAACRKYKSISKNNVNGVWVYQYVTGAPRIYTKNEGEALIQDIVSEVLAEGDGRKFELFHLAKVTISKLEMAARESEVVRNDIIQDFMCKAKNLTR